MKKILILSIFICFTLIHTTTTWWHGWRRLHHNRQRNAIIKKNIANKNVINHRINNKLHLERKKDIYLKKQIKKFRERI